MEKESSTLLGLDSLLRKAGGEVDFLHELVESFGPSCQKDIGNMESAIAHGEASALEFSAHSLKGALQNFFSGRVVQLAYSLELAGREGDLSGAAERLGELKQELQKVGAELEQAAREW